MRRVELRSSRPDPDECAAAEVRADCRRRALDLLARREHSRAELTAKLGARGFDVETLAGVMDRLEHEGLLADERFAETFIRARIDRGQGPLRIRAELARRGIRDDHARRLLAAAAVDWVAAAAAVRVRRFGPARPADRRERARQARFLQSRGFDHGDIMTALDLTGDLD